MGITLPSDGGNRYLPPRTRRGVVAEIADLVSGAQAGGAQSLSPLIAVAHATPRLAIVSDFLDDLERVLRPVRAHIAAGGEVHLVHVVAIEELEPPHRPLVAVDPEDSALQRTFAEPVRVAYQTAFREWREGLARMALQAGASYTLASTSEPAERIVRKVVTAPGAANRPVG